MGKRGQGYGSEDALLTYLENDPARLNAAIAGELRRAGTVEWLPFPQTKTGPREFRGLEFLQAVDDLPERDVDIDAAWSAFWPQTGKRQTWDAVGRLGETWLLVEAKANHPEFVSPPTGATGDGLKRIHQSLGQVKRSLGVHRFFDWTGTYYQHANRLAAVWFLTRYDVPAVLVEVFFTGDVFPDETPCPADEHEWRQLIEARRLTLGLPEQHALSARVIEVFLPARA